MADPSGAATYPPIPTNYSFNKEPWIIRRDLTASNVPARFLTLPMLYALVASGHGAGLLPRSLAVASDWNVMRPIRDAKARIAVWLTERRGEEPSSIAAMRALLLSARRPA